MTAESTLDVVMPQMGVSVSEGTVTKWLKNVGDTIRADETLLEISTDKVDTEVPSPGTGVIEEILVLEGQTVTVGTVLARLALGAAAAAAPAVEAPPAAAPPASAPPPAAEPVELPAPLPAEIADEEETDVTPEVEPPTFISPVVARIASEHGIDPSTVTGTGRDGRVTKKDMQAAVEARTAPPEPAPAPAPAPESPVAAAPIEPPAPQPPVAAAAPTPPVAPPAPRPPVAFPPPEASPLNPGERLEPMTAMRKGIAEHMRRSIETAAHVTSAIEVDMSRVAAIRERLKGDLQSAYGLNPTYLAFVARAAVDTIRDWPLVNAEIRGDSIVTRSYVNLGFAVSLAEGKGLIVPVLKHAEGLNLLGMVRGIADLAERARTKRLLPDDVQGGTFTITNPGGFGTFMGTPIINQPQTAILGTYAVVKRPWVITDDAGKDAIGIRPMMNLTLTYDHRLVDGAYGAQFLRDLAQRLQSWSEEPS